MRRVLDYGVEAPGKEATRVMDVLARVEHRAQSLILKRQLGDELPEQVEVEVNQTVHHGPSAREVAHQLLANAGIRAALDEG